MLRRLALACGCALLAASLSAQAATAPEAGAPAVSAAVWVPAAAAVLVALIGILIRVLFRFDQRVRDLETVAPAQGVRDNAALEAKIVLLDQRLAKLEKGVRQAALLVGDDP
ncbi:MAG: hypothetical protein OXP74_10980 [Acidobacteriota bacterium]|nr:hypothetical protein [Acidobacteriota bacterium]